MTIKDANQQRRDAAIKEFGEGHDIVEKLIQEIDAFGLSPDEVAAGREVGKRLMRTLGLKHPKPN